MQVLRIKDVVWHTPRHKTLFFDGHIEATPGQFVMVWIPGVDEVPMSLSHIGENPGITVENVGEATRALHAMEKGRKVGVRGPYGHGFKTVGKNALFVTGGTGVAPLLPLIVSYPGERDVVLGARTADLMLFEDDMQPFARVHVSTDDGSRGFRGFATDCAKRILEQKRFDVVYTCGPEIMMHTLLATCRTFDVPMQASLERYMKCGLGICDSCAIDGYHVCRDGPVFDRTALEGMGDFGRWKRAPSGRRVKV
jgi:dihydroorotate dehydrogenase electron transfer subunit